MGERALVVGGSGFIGGHLLRRLAKAGHFSSIDSVDMIEANDPLDGVRYHVRDAREALPVELADHRTTIFNLAAHRTFPGFPDEEYFKTNVGITKSVLDLARRSGAGTIVFTSTMSVYHPGNDPKTENSPLDPVNAYGASKVEAERLHREWLVEDAGRRLIVCRPAVIFGYRDNGNFTRLATALRKGYFVFVQRKNTIKSAGYVCDLVESMLFALLQPSREILYNFAYPQRYTIEDIALAMCEVGGYRKPRLVLPAWILLAAALPFEIAAKVGFKNPIHRKRIAKLYEATNIIPGWLAQAGFEFQTDIKSALQLWKAHSAPRDFH